MEIIEFEWCFFEIMIITRQEQKEYLLNNDINSLDYKTPIEKENELLNKYKNVA